MPRASQNQNGTWFLDFSSTNGPARNGKIGRNQGNERKVPSLKGAAMPVITVEMWDGRNIDQKKVLVEGITGTFVKIGVPAEAVHVIIHDVPKHNWGTGGKLASENKSA
jgi:4-oxalocrotonate tautomerase